VRVLIAHGLYRQPGGEERHVELLARGLREAGIDVRLHLRGPARDGLRSRVGLAAGLTYRPTAGRDLARELERSPADVVHFHNLLPHLTPAAVRAARRRGSAVVLTAHNLRLACPAGTLLRNGQLHDDCIEGSSLACGLRNPRGSWSESIVYGLALELQRRLRLLQRWVDLFVAPSAFVGHLLVRAGLPAARVRVVANGVPLPDEPASTGRYALFAARLSTEKGVGTLLEAARRQPGMRIVVAGAGPLETAVRAAANGTVAYAGQVDPPTIASLVRQAAFAVVPSEGPESLPFAALEALAAGIPVIASRIGGLPEIVEDGVNGLLVPPGDPDALAQAMASLWHDPSRRAAMGCAARRTAAERFSLEKQTARLVDLYGELRRAA
jgi:glycosyltransferase involved in cell wall biosynthesis